MRQAGMEAAQYESLGRADDALLVKMLQAGLQKLKAGNHGMRRALLLTSWIEMTYVCHMVAVMPWTTVFHAAVQLTHSLSLVATLRVTISC